MPATRKFSYGLLKIKEGPELLPVKARFWMASFGVTLAISTYIFKSNLYYEVTAFGILLGVFGAGVLYWETIISGEETNGIYHQIVREGDSKKLSDSELKSMLWYLQICSLEFVLFMTLFVYKLRHVAAISLNRTIHTSVLLTIASFAPIVLAYALTKFIRVSCNNNAFKMKNAIEEERINLVKTFLRRFGFKTLFVAGALQYVGILIDHYNK